MLIILNRSTQNDDFSDKLHARTYYNTYIRQVYSLVCFERNTMQNVFDESPSSNMHNVPSINGTRAKSSDFSNRLTNPRVLNVPF